MRGLPVTNQEMRATPQPNQGRAVPSPREMPGLRVNGLIEPRAENLFLVRQTQREASARFTPTAVRQSNREHDIS
jgi:hypothetical protein